MAKYFKKAKAYARKVAGAVIKKGVMGRYGSKGGLGRVIKDVAMMKRLVNVEKKHLISGTNSHQKFAQIVDTSGSGHYFANITPQIAQGVSAQERSGNSVKITGAILEFEITSDTSLVNRLDYTISIVRKKDNQSAMTPETAGPLIWEKNPFSPTAESYDTFSNRRVNNMANFQIVKEVRGFIHPDSLTGQTEVRQHRIPLRLNHHLRYDGNQSTAAVTNNYFIYVRANSGSKTAATGALVRYASRFYFTDN